VSFGILWLLQLCAMFILLRLLDFDLLPKKLQKKQKGNFLLVQRLCSA
jgi:hypothetical protein